MCLGVCVYVNIFSYTDTEAPPQSKYYFNIYNIQLCGVLSQ